MKYTTIKGTTIAGDVPCETDGWVRKADLNKLAEWFRKKDLNLADLDEGEQRLGYYHAYRKLDELLGG